MKTDIIRGKTETSNSEDSSSESNSRSDSNDTSSVVIISSGTMIKIPDNYKDFVDPGLVSEDQRGNISNETRNKKMKQNKVRSTRTANRSVMSRNPEGVESLHSHKDGYLSD